jgi:hypothetical protein
MRNKIGPGPAKNIGVVCCGGRTETRNKDAQVNIRPVRWPELRYVASGGLLALSTAGRRPRSGVNEQMAAGWRVSLSFRRLKQPHQRPSSLGR